MTDSLKLVGKRAITIAVAAATILWSVGVSAFLPLTAQAYSAGDLIKGTTLSTVYYYGSDGSRYAFTSEKNYMSWYTDFSGVTTISDSALAAIPLAGNVLNRPGSYWLKITSDAKTYAVTPQGQLRWIETEAAASGLAGSDWNMFILDAADVYFTDYTVGTSITDATNAYNGALVMSGSDEYLVWDGVKRLITDAGWTANRFQTRFLLDGSGVTLAGLSSGSSLTGAEGDLTDSAQLGETVTGGLSVSLASDTPASATVPAGAASVPFTKVKFTASTGSASISQLVFKLGGVGAVANIDEAYLYEGDTRLTDGRSVNSSTREVTFSGLDLDLSSGESMYLSVRADISDAPTGGDTASFYLASASSVVGTATVSGSFPVSGNTMTFSETEAGTVVVSETGSIADPTLGEEEAVVAKFEVEADGEDAWIDQITLNVDDAADHSNYQLWNSDDLISNGTVSGDLVTFVLTNSFFVEDGDTENFEMSADVGGDAGDSISVAIEEEADVLATGGDFGFNLAVDITDYDDTSCADDTESCSYSEIQGGELTFAFNGPSSDDIQIDADDQVLMEFTITSENWVEIQEFEVTLESVGAGADTAVDAGDLLNDAEDEPNLQNVTIREADGSVWMGPEELDATDADAISGDDTAQTLVFTDDQILNAGESLDLMVTVDVMSFAVADDEFAATIEMDTVDAEDVNGDALDASDIVPGADIEGNDFTLADSSLDVEASTPPGDTAYVKGVSGAQVVGFSFEAGNTSDVTVTDVTYTVSADSDAIFDPDDDVTIADHVSSCSMYDNESGALIDGPESPEDVDGAADGDAELIFENFDWTIEAGETAKAILKCNFSNTDLDATDGADDTYAFGIFSADDVTAEDMDGDDVDVDAITETNGDGSEATVTISAEGAITATLDGSSPDSTIILGASTGVSVGVWKFEADDEAFVVETLNFDNGAVDDVASAVKVSCADEAGTTVTKTGFLTGGTVTFENLECYIPTDVTKTISVSIDTNSVSSTGATSGDDFELTLDVSESEATGDASGETIALGGLDSTADVMVLHKTKPTISLASGSPSGAGVPGNNEALRFNVSADSRGFVTLEAITFELAMTDTDNDFNLCDDLADPDSFELYDLDNPSTKLDDDGDWGFLEDPDDASFADDDACTSLAVLKYAVLDFDMDATTGDEEIGAGDTKTYVLKVDTSGGDEDDSIRVDLPGQSDFGDVTEGETLYDVDPTTTEGDTTSVLDAIRWDDDTEGDDFDGDLVKSPITGGTVAF